MQFEDRIEHGQQKLNLVHLIIETLEEIERSGGLEASINIRYMVPPYQS
jgi:hypothetical protein